MGRGPTAVPAPRFAASQAPSASNAIFEARFLSRVSTPIRMASFCAELHVASHVYPLRHCTYAFTQATDMRGRVVAKVRHGRVELVLDVPPDNFLEHWATTAYQPLAGRVVFYDSQGGAARETLAWEAGHCVGYREEFNSGPGNGGAGAYLCLVTIVAPKLTVQPGGRAAYVRPAARDHGTPQALVDPFVLPLLTPAPVAPLAEAVAETVAEVVVKTTAATVLGPIALVLALILGTATPAGGPGIPQYPMVPVGRDELRLRELVTRHAAGTLTASEEAELIALLGSVKGIHVRSLSDLNVHAPLKGDTVPLPGFHTISLAYTKRTTSARKALRNKFDASIRKNFIKHLGNSPEMRARLKQSGLTNSEIDDMGNGIRPDKYQVHHKLPLDDGGDNSFDNLMLIKHDPFHKSITNSQLDLTKGMNAGDTRLISWPTYNGSVYP